MLKGQFSGVTDTGYAGRSPVCVTRPNGSSSATGLNPQRIIPENLADRVKEVPQKQFLQVSYRACAGQPDQLSRCPDSFFLPRYVMALRQSPMRRVPYRRHTENGVADNPGYQANYCHFCWSDGTGCATASVRPRCCAFWSAWPPRRSARRPSSALRRAARRPAPPSRPWTRRCRWSSFELTPALHRGLDRADREPLRDQPAGASAATCCPG